ncbi:MAG TPA: PEGA domain-containing protein, partial [Polyangia bacterium]|nr:PEGA domain-containing protein [Polyangia bacterium]
KRRLEATTTSSIVKDRMGTDLSAGTSFELDDVEKEKERGTAPTEYAMPSRPDLAPRPLGGSTAQVSATARRPRRRSGFMFGVIFALAIVAGLLYAKNWAEQKGVIGALGLGGDTGEKGPPADSPAPTTQAPSPPAPNPTATGTTAPAPPTAPPAPPSAPVVAAGVADAAAHAAPPPAPNPVAQAPAADARAPVAENHPTEDKATPPAPPTTADKTDKQAGQAAQAGQAGQAGKDEDDEPDEEALLRDAVPNAEEAVIGEEEAEAPPAPKPGAKKQPPPKQKAPPPKQAAAEKPSPPPAPAKPQTAVLHITSAPAGAIVRTKARVLGRTPINLHFKTGNTYELKLVKRGYTPATRKVAVNNAQDRKVAVTLKKKPKPRAKHRTSFFHPHR